MTRSRPLVRWTLALAAVAIVAACWGLLAWGRVTPEPLPDGARVDHIVVTKAAHRLDLYQGGRVIATYEVSLGRGAAGPKEREGDRRTPEGHYTIDYHKPDSSCFRALHVSYPNAADRARARALGVQPGGAIMIHGVPNRWAFVGRLQRLYDWTAGCIALTNPEIQQVYDATPDGTPVDIQP